MMILKISPVFGAKRMYLSGGPKRSALGWRRIFGVIAHGEFENAVRNSA